MAKDSNVLAVWGNKESMNLNSLVLNNIMSSQYFKNALYEKKTYHEVVDEIYYQVKNNFIYFILNFDCFLLGQTFRTMGKR
jgi:pre-mRNA-splicing factor 38B